MSQCGGNKRNNLLKKYILLKHKKKCTVTSNDSRDI